MNKQITYTDVYSQLEKLKSQNLIISDEAFAISALSRYGYSNLIKSYREPYIIRYNDSIYYKDGVTFEQILSLFILDKNLRNSVMAAMLDLEEFIKEAAADVISKSFSTASAKYLNYRNYANKKRRKKRFTLSETLEKIKKHCIQIKIQYTTICQSMVMFHLGYSLRGYILLQLLILSDSLKLLSKMK